MSIIVEDFQAFNHKYKDKKLVDEWQNRSTILICPCSSKGIHPKIVQNWMWIQAPMNTGFLKMFPIDEEVGVAYSKAIEYILSDPNLSKFKYVATLEHDNTVKHDWLLQIYPDMEKKGGYDVIGALYYTKGYPGYPMCYGKPGEVMNFIPFEPAVNAVTRCNGLGMGATVFKLDIFRNPKLPKPFFQTVQHDDGTGFKAYTQDLRFFENAGLLGYKFGCTTKTVAGHMDLTTGTIY